MDYVIVGPPERRYAEGLCASTERTCDLQASFEKFRDILEPVFEQGQTAVYRVPDA